MYDGLLVSRITEGTDLGVEQKVTMAATHCSSSSNGVVSLAAKQGARRGWTKQACRSRRNGHIAGSPDRPHPHPRPAKKDIAGTRFHSLRLHLAGLLHLQSRPPPPRPKPDFGFDFLVKHYYYHGGFMG